MEKETIESITNPKYDEGITLLHETTAADADIISLISVDAENLSEPTENENKVEICEEENISNDRYFTADSLDSIKTGESVFKLFTFDPKKCTTNVDKCVSFWKTINEMDLKPVDCSIYTPKKCKSRQSAKSVQHEQSSQEKVISEESLNEVTRQNLDETQISWCDALKELQKRKLDRVARVAKPLGCKFCDTLTFELEEDKDSCTNHDEIVALNHWRPGRIKKKQTNEARALKVRTKPTIQESTIEAETPKTALVPNEIEQNPSKEDKTFEMETETLEESATDEIPLTETKETESCLSLMESVLKDVLAKMSEEIDVKQLVNEIVTSATEKIKEKSNKQLQMNEDAKINNKIVTSSTEKLEEKSSEQIQRKKEEKNYAIPPYSFTGEYPCTCEKGITCECEKVVRIPSETIVEKQGPVDKKVKKVRKPNKINMSTQWPEVQTQKSEKVIKGSYCIICGLSNCICKYIAENRDNNDVLLHKCDAFDSDCM